MKKFFTVLLGIIVTAFLTIIPVSANSAVKGWSSYETQGIFIMGDNPIEVSSEHLTFDFSKNDSFVTAEYNLYNSSDYDVECELVFPVGKINRYNIFDEYEGVYYYYPEVFFKHGVRDSTGKFDYSDATKLITEPCSVSDFGEKWFTLPAETIKTFVQ